MIEIRTITEYKNFLSDLPPAKLDNFMANFMFSFSQIRVGCNCKMKARVKGVEERKLKSITNMPKSSEGTIQETYKDNKIIFYHDDKIVKTIENE